MRIGQTQGPPAAFAGGCSPLPGTRAGRRVQLSRLLLPLGALPRPHFALGEWVPRLRWACSFLSFGERCG